MNKVETAIKLFKATNHKQSCYENKELSALIKSMTEKEFQEYAEKTESWQINH